MELGLDSGTFRQPTISSVTVKRIQLSTYRLQLTIIVSESTLYLKKYALISQLGAQLGPLILYMVVSHFDRF